MSLAETFWMLADRPKAWREHTPDERTVWLMMADTAFETGRNIKAGVFKAKGKR